MTPAPRFVTSSEIRRMQAMRDTGAGFKQVERAFGRSRWVVQRYTTPAVQDDARRVAARAVARRLIIERARGEGRP